MTTCDKLRQCPWCGKQPSLEPLNFQRYKGWWIGCRNPGCAVHPYMGERGKPSKAIAAWNRRPPCDSRTEKFVFSVADRLTLDFMFQILDDNTRFHPDYSKLLRRMVVALDKEPKP